MKTERDTRGVMRDAHGKPVVEEPLPQMVLSVNELQIIYWALHDAEHSWTYHGKDAADLRVRVYEVLMAGKVAEGAHL